MSIFVLKAFPSGRAFLLDRFGLDDVPFLWEKKRYQKKTLSNSFLGSPYSLCGFGFLRYKLVGQLAADKFGMRFLFYLHLSVGKEHLPVFDLEKSEVACGETAGVKHPKRTRKTVAVI